MCPPPALTREPAIGIAALIGGMLGMLLRALLGLSRRDAARRDSLEGVVAGVLAAEAAIVLEYEPEVEWEWVPAPWRNGQLLPRRHARALSIALPCRPLRRGAFGRGPPLRGVMLGRTETGFAQGRSAGDSAWPDAWPRLAGQGNRWQINAATQHRRRRWQ
jgi:hypothetical protein